jgi:hypothetical protein
MVNLILSVLISIGKNEVKIFNLQYKKNYHFDDMTSPILVPAIAAEKFVV